MDLVTIGQVFGSHLLLLHWCGCAAIRDNLRGKLAVLGPCSVLNLVSIGPLLKAGLQMLVFCFVPVLDVDLCKLAIVGPGGLLALITIEPVLC